MFQSWFQHFAGRASKASAAKGRRTKTWTPWLERLEDRCVPVVTGVSPTPFTGTEGAAALINGGFTDSNLALTPTDFNVTINYGDGTAVSTAAKVTAVGGPGTGSFAFTDTHTYAEEAGSTVPPFFFPVSVTVAEKVGGSTQTATTTAGISDAPLAPGNPVVAGAPTNFSGAGAAAATTALNNFTAATGGANNLDTAPQANGFRRVNWDGVKLDGTDFGGNSIVIKQNSTVAIPLNRFQQRGVYFGAQYAVSGDGFVGDNPGVGGSNPALFPAFSPKNTFAMFNDNGIDFKFVVPSGVNTTVVPAASRGFGAVFLNVTQANTTSIQFFHGAQLLSTIFAPVGGQGQPVFVGQLFGSAIVTNVQLTLGTDVIFKFDGTTLAPGSATDGVAGANLVATDDFVYAEPQAIANGFPIVSGGLGTAGALNAINAVPNAAFTGTVASFSDLDPNGNAKDFTAIINWGDGHSTPGKITANKQGGFDVSGTNTFTNAGTFAVSTDIQDFGGALVSVTATAKVNFATQNQRVVAQMYQDLLNRPVDPGGLALFGGLLDANGLTRQQVAQQIVSSQEFHVAEVTSAFQALLKRSPDAIGLNFFVQQLNSGTTVEAVKAQIMGSAEYLSTRGGGTANGTLNTIFLDVLGRAPSASDLAFFNPELTNNVPLTQIATQVLTSPEAYQDLVKTYYPIYLRRAADPAGVAFFANALQTGARDEDVIAAVLGSPEYFNAVK